MRLLNPILTKVIALVTLLTSGAVAPKLGYALQKVSKVPRRVSGNCKRLLSLVQFVASLAHVTAGILLSVKVYVSEHIYPSRES